MERNVTENLRLYRQQCATLFGKLDEQNRRHVAGLIALTLGARRRLLRCRVDRVGPPVYNKFGKWLRLRKFSLKSNVKRLSGPPHPDRDRQFRLIRREVTRRNQIRRNLGLPVISVDAKNAELVGDFANSGQK